MHMFVSIVNLATLLHYVHLLIIISSGQGRSFKITLVSRLGIRLENSKLIAHTIEAVTDLRVILEVEILFIHTKLVNFKNSSLI